MYICIYICIQILKVFYGICLKFDLFFVTSFWSQNFPLQFIQQPYSNMYHKRLKLRPGTFKGVA